MTSQTLLDRVLEPSGLSMMFQPIVRAEGGVVSLFALEALARGPAGTNVERADVLFEYVRRKGREIEVDRACVRTALQAAAPLTGDPTISINVHATTLERDDNFTSFLAQTCSSYGIAMERLILEIVEQQKFWDPRRFFFAVHKVRAHGVRIAMDDIGLGYSNFRMLIEVRPELFKIDRYFVSGCAEKPEGRAAIESIALLATRLGGLVIAEGIETSDDFETVESLGIDLMQGYFIARPRKPESFLEPTLEQVKEIS